MNTKSQVKQKRHKKRKSRTEVSSDSESEVDRKQAAGTQEKSENESVPASSSKDMNEAEVSAAFSKYYMQRATAEFAEDLDKIRGADDFKDEALSILVGALQQGTKGFSIEEQRRVVTVEGEVQEGE